MHDDPADVVFRRYEARDRAAVRNICYVTGYMGDPIDWQWRDAESFADMFSAYYTDEEPRAPGWPRSTER